MEKHNDMSLRGRVIFRPKQSPSQCWRLLRSLSVACNDEALYQKSGCLLQVATFLFNYAGCFFNSSMKCLRNFATFGATTA